MRDFSSIRATCASCGVESGAGALTDQSPAQERSEALQNGKDVQHHHWLTIYAGPVVFEGSGASSGAAVRTSELPTRRRGAFRQDPLLLRVGDAVRGAARLGKPGHSGISRRGSRGPSALRLALGQRLIAHEAGAALHHAPPRWHWRLSRRVAVIRGGEQGAIITNWRQRAQVAAPPQRRKHQKGQESSGHGLHMSTPSSFRPSFPDIPR